MTLLVLLACFGLGYLSIGLGHQFVVAVVVSETGIVQNLGAFAFVAAAVSYFVAYLRSRVLFALLLSVALFVGAGEELSWGQHLLAFEPPAEVAAANEQGELTIHNLSVLQGSEGGELNPIDRAFLVFGLTFTLLLPLAAASSLRLRKSLGRVVPLVPIGFGLLFTANFALSKLAEFVSSPTNGHAIVEIKETNFAIVFVAIGLHAAQHVDAAARSTSFDGVKHDASRSRRWSVKAGGAKVVR